MLDPSHPLAELLRRDDRYKFDSYVFVFDALRFAQEKLNMGRVTTAGGKEESPEEISDLDDLEGDDAFDINLDAEFEEDFDEDFEGDFDDSLDDSLDKEFADEDFMQGEFAENGDLADAANSRQRHVSGQELCEAIRCYALDQYGLLAKSVLNEWGVHSTGDFGEIVFNLIEIGQMRKTDSDRREDFNDVYDFAHGLANPDAYWQQQKSGKSDGDGGDSTA